MSPTSRPISPRHSVERAPLERQAPGAPHSGPWRAAPPCRRAFLLEARRSASWAAVIFAHHRCPVTFSRSAWRGRATLPGVSTYAVEVAPARHEGQLLWRAIISVDVRGPPALARQGLRGTPILLSGFPSISATSRASIASVRRVAQAGAGAAPPGERQRLSFQQDDRGSCLRRAPRCRLSRTRISLITPHLEMLDGLVGDPVVDEHPRGSPTTAPAMGEAAVRPDAEGRGKSPQEERRPPMMVGGWGEATARSTVSQDVPVRRALRADDVSTGAHALGSSRSRSGPRGLNPR